MHDMMLVSAIASKQQAAELYNGAQSLPTACSAA
jgi:hypothetical protein